MLLPLGEENNYNTSQKIVLIQHIGQYKVPYFPKQDQGVCSRSRVGKNTTSIKIAAPSLYIYLLQKKDSGG